MLHRSSTGAFAVVAALMVTIGVAQAADEANYPNWKGQWNAVNPRLGGQAIKFDPTKAWGPAQQAPLTPEYQKVRRRAWPIRPRADSATTPPPGVSRAACRA
jgi:hypothetical protein